MAITVPKEPYYRRDVEHGISQSADDAKPKYIRALFYGPQGTGKTLAAASFPDPVIINLDNGMSTLSVRGIFVPSESFYYGNPIYTYIFQILNDCIYRTGPFASGEKYADRKTLIIETGTELMNHFKYEVMAIEGAWERGKGGATLLKGKPTEISAEWPHYNVMGERMLEILRKLRDVGHHMHVVMTALDTWDDKRDCGLPDIEGSVRTKMGAAFDEVYHFLTDSSSPGMPKYVAYTRPYMKYEAKSRYGSAMKIENVSFSKIVEEWEKARPGITSDIVRGVDVTKGVR